jgi:hypothetical protein
MRFNSNVLVIGEQNVTLSLPGNETLNLKNDLVYIFAGGELPTQFLQKAGIEITTRFGHTMLKHPGGDNEVRSRYIRNSKNHLHRHDAIVPIPGRCQIPPGNWRRHANSRHGIAQMS